MKFEKIHIDKLKEAKYNPRLNLQPGDIAYEQLKRSILEFNYIDPIVWNKRSGIVVGGHQRLKILKELGHTEIMVSVVDLDEKNEKALNIAHNKIGGHWEEFKLKSLLEDIYHNDDIDHELSGFQTEEIDDIINVYDKDELDSLLNNEYDAKSKYATLEDNGITVKNGDIYQLGKHKLYCKDEIPEGITANLVVTFAQKDANMERLEKAMDNEASYYIFHEDRDTVPLRENLKKAKFKIAQVLIWEKSDIIKGTHYHTKHTPILYGWKEKGKHNWNADRKQTTVLEYETPSESNLPTDMLSFIITNSSKQKQIVLDPNGEFGDVLIAAEETKRRAVIIEKDPKKAQIIIDRWERFTNEKARKL